MTIVPHTAYIALGSNMGRRKKNVAAALNALEATRDVDVEIISPLYETLPEGGPDDQAPYINGVVRVRTTLSPERLLAVCQNIEDSLGRKRTIRWGPRTIDLDLLLYESEIRCEPELTLPHPMMHLRTFVMRPLVDIAPDGAHPVFDETFAEILTELEARA